MNIQITPNYHFNLPQNRNCTTTKPKFTPNYLNSLPQDTVSFSGNVSKVASKSVTKIGQVVKDTYISHIPAYTIAANKLEDTMISIAEKFKDKGISYDRAYNKDHGVKGADTYVDKFIRSGDDPLDKIRRTMFMENLYDLKFFTQELIPEFEKRGYNIYMEPVMSGKKVVARKPNCAYRLDGLSDKNLKGIREDLAGCAGHPQKSGYEDIQVRFIDSSLPKKKQIPMEVLFLFGKNYALAKHDESKYVYNITREFDERFHISKIKNPDIHSYAGKIQRNIGIIEDTLRNNISKPLFCNAKNLDYYHEKIQLPVQLSEESCKVLMGLMEGIREKTDLFYKEKAKLVCSKDFEPELIRKIKATASFKARGKKEVTAKDIANAKKIELDKIDQAKDEDLEYISKAKKTLEKTIEKYEVKTIAPEK